MTIATTSVCWHQNATKEDVTMLLMGLVLHGLCRAAAPDTAGTNGVQITIALQLMEQPNLG